MLNKDVLIILVAPNVTEQMGGEGIKALQIFQEVRNLHASTIQITHERNKRELSNRLNLPDVYYVCDTKFALFLWRSRILRKLLDPWFCYKAVKMAESIAAKRALKASKVIIHQTEPNSPVIPRFVSRRHKNVFGPINGNIYYPRIFHRHERISTRLRRMFHMPVQRVNRLLFRGLASADLILYAGGARTKESLLAAGCSIETLVETLDCGIKNEILAVRRAEHRGKNVRFFHYGGRFHKGTFLIIESLVKTKNVIFLDIAGRGPDIEQCKTLVRTLGLSERVRFLGWFEQHRDLLDSLRQYRGGLLPSLEDANGIFVQEAMAIGLPMICLNWGGPQLLVDNGITGYLVEPLSKKYIVDKIAEHLDELSINGELAERMSLASREKAEAWRWSQVAHGWINLYDRLLERC